MKTCVVAFNFLFLLALLACGGTPEAITNQLDTPAKPAPSDVVTVIAEPTPAVELRRLSRQTDQIFSQIKKAADTDLFERSSREDNGKSYGAFQRGIQVSIENLRKEIRKVEPQQAKVLVGEPAGLLIRLSLSLHSDTPLGSEEFRDNYRRSLRDREQLLAEMENEK